MIIAVWIRAAALGCRAIASTAEATARPWPSPHSPAASAMPRPAASTAKGPIQLPSVVASAADATPGNATTTASPPHTSERDTPDPPLECCLLVMIRVVLGRLDR